MFSDLMSVLQNTIVTLTISRIDDQLLRVNIVPKRKTDKHSDAENALSKPLTVTAPPAELDQDFARQVLSFSHSYQRSAAKIREIEEAHAAAVKAAEEERKAKKPRRRRRRRPHVRQRQQSCARRKTGIWQHGAKWNDDRANHTVVVRHTCRRSERRAGKGRANLVLPQLLSRANRKGERAQLRRSHRPSRKAR